jgi:ATP-dependent Lhr-like helicase
VLDGRSLEVTRVVLGTIHARPTTQEAYLPRWTSDRPSLTRELAREVAAFRYEAGRILLEQGFKGLSRWLGARYPCGPGCAELLGELFEGQARASEIPNSHGILVEASPGECGGTILHAFHAPLHRAACEALARACAARYGRLLGRNLSIAVADLGWAIELPVETGIELSDELKRQLLDPQGFRQDVLEGLERGELLAKRFQKIAATALMVLKNPQPGQRVRVGGLNWVAARLYPLIKAACPDHPLILETRREVLEDLLDLPSALAWLESRPCIQVRRLDVPSPFTRAWITPATPEPVAFESTAQALARLHRRLTLAASGAAQ